jgi:hypothetical protein
MNQIVATSSFSTADGLTHLLGDVALFAEMSKGGINQGNGSSTPSEYISSEAVVG